MKLNRLNPIQINQKDQRTKAIIALSLVCFFWGTTWVASREGVRNMPALQMAGIRQTLGGSLYFLYFMGKGRVLPRGREWGPILILSLLNFVGSNGLSTWGVKYISAGLGSIIGAIFPLWIVIISLFRSEKLPAKAIAGILTGFAGICVIFYEHMADFMNPQFTFGIFLSIAATWCWAFGTLYTKEKAASFNPYFSLGLQMIISGVALLGLTKATGVSVPLREIPLRSWGAIAYLVVFGSVFSFIAYLYALQHLPTHQASIYAYINPVVALLMGALLFDEKLTMFIAAGGVITLLGVYLVNQSKEAQVKKSEPPSDQPASQ